MSIAWIPTGQRASHSVSSTQAKLLISEAKRNSSPVSLDVDRMSCKLFTIRQYSWASFRKISLSCWEKFSLEWVTETNGRVIFHLLIEQMGKFRFANSLQMHLLRCTKRLFLEWDPVTECCNSSSKWNPVTSKNIRNQILTHPRASRELNENTYIRDRKSVV